MFFSPVPSIWRVDFNCIKDTSTNNTTTDSKFCGILCVCASFCAITFLYTHFCVCASFCAHVYVGSEEYSIMFWVFFVCVGFMCTITTSTCFCFCKAWHAHPCQWDTALLGGSGRVVNSLDFCPALLKSLGCFASGKWDFLHNGKQWQWICEFYTANFKVIFGGP